jgi:hypothetical protein
VQLITTSYITAVNVSRNLVDLLPHTNGIAGAGTSQHQHGTQYRWVGRTAFARTMPVVPPRSTLQDHQPNHAVMPLIVLRDCVSVSVGWLRQALEMRDHGLAKQEGAQAPSLFRHHPLLVVCVLPLLGLTKHSFACLQRINVDSLLYTSIIDSFILNQLADQLPDGSAVQSLHMTGIPG